MPLNRFLEAAEALITQAKINSDHVLQNDTLALTSSDKIVSQSILEMANSIPHLTARRNLRVISSLYQRCPRASRQDITMVLVNGVINAGTEPGTRMKWIDWVNNRSTTAGSGRRGIDTIGDINRDKVVAAIDAAASLDMVVLLNSLGGKYWKARNDQGQPFDRITVIHGDEFRSIWYQYDDSIVSNGSGDEQAVNEGQDHVSPVNTSQNGYSFPCIFDLPFPTDRDSVIHFNQDGTQYKDFTQPLPAKEWHDIQANDAIPSAISGRIHADIARHANGTVEENDRYNPPLSVNMDTVDGDETISSMDALEEACILS